MRLRSVSAIRCIQVGDISDCPGRHRATGTTVGMLLTDREADVLKDESYNLPHCCCSCAHDTVRIPGSSQQPKADPQYAAD